MDPLPMPAEPEHWTWEQPDGRGLDVVWRQQGQGPESSDAPAVVLVHGFGASSGHWRYTMPSLATQTPTFALDLIGFGGSSQPTCGACSAACSAARDSAASSDDIRRPAIASAQSSEQGCCR